MVGSENTLNQIWDWTCDYICRFDYSLYPFDTQNCPMIINTSHNHVEIKGENIIYSGPSDLGKYYYKSINHCTKDVYGRSGMFIDFTFKVNQFS